ncbi:hypothetical protein [Dinghuibacter silviterrae]|uniref:Uncharacterized protein n=1 Tax=Dinghuibacter silviterrae TaxID=1539049 RepID=A0A4R8DHY9_9BACT|nr:hypothetical protein [Dinghuibacter silviterrae]TDW96884.1 hypothetical protein EDB95_4720 [Dinghuibacter silviterrae]
MRKALFLFVALFSIPLLMPTAKATGKSSTAQLHFVMGSFLQQGYTVGYVFNTTTNTLEELVVENAAGQEVPISTWTGSVTGNPNTWVVTFSNVYILLSNGIELGPINYQS